MEEGSEGKLWPAIRKLFSGKSTNHVENLIREATEEGDIKSDEASMLLNVLGLRQKQVCDVMVPRPDIVAAEETSTLHELADIIIERGHSRIPVYKENKDHIIGLIHAKDLLSFLLNPDQKFELGTIIRQPLYIPETKNLEKMILEFQLKKAHLAIAVDEYGGTSGLVTFEDVLEEIVGEIEDEYDEPRPEEIQLLEDKRLLVSGRAMLEDLEKECDISLASNQVETVGGYVTEQIGRVPEAGEFFDLEGYRIIIRDADAKQIHWVFLEPLMETQPE